MFEAKLARFAAADIIAQAAPFRASRLFAIVLEMYRRARLRRGLREVQGNAAVYEIRL